MKNTEYCRISGNCSDLSGESGKKGSKEEKAFGIDLERDGDGVTARRDSMRTYMKVNQWKLCSGKANGKALGHVEKWQTEENGAWDAKWKNLYSNHYLVFVV